MNRSRAMLCALAAAALLAACQSAYYKAMETFGQHKRDILISRVSKARDSQQEAKEQFQTALERFRSVVAFDGGALEEKYETLNAEYKRSEARANEVHQRVKDVENVAEALFDEWERELGEYENRELKAKSEAKLRETRTHYEQLIGAMRRAEAKIDPVLRPLRDQVLYIKHNLNAQAIASLQAELRGIEGDVDSLVRVMEAAIAEADAFIQAMNQ